MFSDINQPPPHGRCVSSKTKESRRTLYLLQYSAAMRGNMELHFLIWRRRRILFFQRSSHYITFYIHIGLGYIHYLYSFFYCWQLRKTCINHFTSLHLVRISFRLLQFPNMGCCFYVKKKRDGNTTTELFTLRCAFLKKTEDKK